MNPTRSLAIAGLAALSVLSVACAKKVAVAPPPAPVRAAEPAPAVARTTTPTPAPVSQRSEAATPAPRPRYPDAATVQQIQELLDRIQDAYFDYNQHQLRQDAQATLTADSKALADILKQYPDYKLTVEGYCDERGSAEYNLALGEARAKAAKEYLVSLGLPGEQLKTVSFGKEKPVCTEADESCWQKNRRAHVTAAAMR